MIQLSLDEKSLFLKVIEKAGNNGYHLRSSTNFDWIMEHYSVEEILFDHAFAKSFFGEEEVCSYCRKPVRRGQDFFDHVDETGCTQDYECYYRTPRWRLFLEILALTPPSQRIGLLKEHVSL